VGHERRLWTLLGAAAIAAVWLSALVAARQSPPPAPQTFRGGVELIRLDVSVLDKDRKPVTGLTAADFTIVEDGEARPLQTFAAVELPGPSPVTATWMRDVPADVTTNENVGGQAMVIVIDDASINAAGEAVALTNTVQLASAAVREMGPQDIAAVVSTEYNHYTQDFTGDRALLLDAIKKTYLFPSLTGGGDSRASCVCGVCSVRVLEKAAAALRQLTQQRKTILFISVGMEIPDGAELQAGVPGGGGFGAGCMTERVSRTIATMREAQLTNVTIHAIDPNGLTAAGGRRIEFLRALAYNTGGRAVVNNNDPGQYISSIMEESRSYYLLGFVPTSKTRTGGFHPIKVRVNRPDVEVRSRIGYYTPTEKERKSEQLKSTGVDRSIESPVPSGGVPLAVTAAPFLDATGKPVTTIVLTVSQPKEAGDGKQKTERVQVITSAFGQEAGNHVSTLRQTLNIVWNPSEAYAAQYEVRSRLPLAPGRYELRVGVKSPDRDGSVYTYVDVPKFDKDDLSVSGVVVTSTPAAKAAPVDAFASIIPVAPTAQRVFRSTDRASVFLRTYQRGARTPLPLTATMRVIDANDRQALEATQRLEPETFPGERSSDYTVRIPADRLPRGEYLMKIDISNGTRTVQRTMRFKVN
jgi:VWFA-related protein